MDLSKLTMYDACLLHSRADRVLRGLVANHLEKFTLTRMDWLVLATAGHQAKSEKGHTMTELSELLDIRLSQLTALVSKLQAASLLSQKTARHDRRTRYVSITAKGQGMLDKIEYSMRSAFREWLADIPHDQLSVYMATVEQLAVER